MGDEGADMANLARAVERKQLYQQRKAWKKKHGSLWSQPDPCPVVRVHPGVTLAEVLSDKRLVVPNVSSLLLCWSSVQRFEIYLISHTCWHCFFLSFWLHLFCSRRITRLTQPSSKNTSVLTLSSQKRPVEQQGMLVILNMEVM